VKNVVHKPVEADEHLGFLQLGGDVLQGIDNL
jgi:hypothetical protein